MPRKRRIHFFFVVASPEDEMLANYYQNPPFPYRTTAELIRVAMSSFSMPLAAKNAGMDKERVAALAIAAIKRLRMQADEIERECVPHTAANVAQATPIVQSESSCVTNEPAPRRIESGSVAIQDPFRGMAGYD